tara:strand:- start:1611 stop:2033 length:423 start_codon:yes stop_codon:yes gene_type:complete
MNEKNDQCCSEGRCESGSAESKHESTVLKDPRAAACTPRYTSTYDEAAWEVSIRLPGVSKVNVKVSIENEILELSALRTTDTPEGWRPLADYVTQREYQLRLDVGPEVDPARVTAVHENGVLNLRLPLREEAKPREIKVQ